MTKKHFEAAAAYVRGYRFWKPGERELVTEAFVAVCREFNGRFDAERFRAACRGQDATDSAGRTVRYGVRS